MPRVTYRSYDGNERVVDLAWLDRLGPPTDIEQTMLDFGEAISGNSRLACQIRLTAELDGLVVTTPRSQH